MIILAIRVRHLNFLIKSSTSTTIISLTSNKSKASVIPMEVLAHSSIRLTEVWEIVIYIWMPCALMKKR
jgi:hypothetical protein